jgi:hypothetical protein
MKPNDKTTKTPAVMPVFCACWPGLITLLLILLPLFQAASQCFPIFVEYKSYETVRQKGGFETFQTTSPPQYYLIRNISDSASGGTWMTSKTPNDNDEPGDDTEDTFSTKWSLRSILSTNRFGLSMKRNSPVKIT